jgi:hypothetical protein
VASTLIFRLCREKVAGREATRTSSLVPGMPVKAEGLLTTLDAAPIAADNPHPF